MALPFSAVQLADLRRRFLTTLTGRELRQLATDLAAAIQEADAKAGAAQATASAAATPGDIDAAVSPLATTAALALAVSGLASEAFVNGKFAGTYNSGVADASKVLIDGVYYPVVNGLIMIPAGP